MAIISSSVMLTVEMIGRLVPVYVPIPGYTLGETVETTAHNVLTHLVIDELLRGVVLAEHRDELDYIGVLQRVLSIRWPEATLGQAYIGIKVVACSVEAQYESAILVLFWHPLFLGSAARHGTFGLETLGS